MTLHQNEAQRRADAIKAKRQQPGRAAQVGDFMRVMGQPVRDTPTSEIPDDERRLRARLVYEEAVEFATAMGMAVNGWDPADGLIDLKEPHNRIDLVEAADALADLLVVVYGSAHTLGIPIKAVFDAVHETNMAKAPGGVVTRREDGKVLKPDGWVPPTAAIKEILRDAIGSSWNPSTGGPECDWCGECDWCSLQ